MSNEYLNILERSENIVFLPSVGKLYGKNGSIFKNQRKLLILGESFYCIDKHEKCNGKCSAKKVKENRDCRFWSESVVFDEHVAARNSGIKNKWVQGYLSCEKAFFGYEVDPQLRTHFWNSVCFYNYFTEPQDGPSQNLSFSDETWERSKKAFIDVINILQPDAVICWGNRTWECLPDFGERVDSIKTDDITGEVWFYPFKDKNEGTYVLLHSPHPSRPIGNSFDLWHEVYKIFLKDFYNFA